MKKETQETKTKKVVKQYLSLSGWFYFHILQGLGAYKGIPDFFAIKNGNCIWIEVKAPKGIQSDNQKEFEKNIKEKGGHYILARNIQDIDDYVKKNFGETSFLI